ncbi:glutathione transport system permease protein GsiC [Oxobacter pfennigii]|uniref:Glutathione transport system permease protein GsiC n=1 Tax=Oxobacter pfennigii TaxID=36849 RepID=A0A0P8WJV5_9CLOT|nr:ABC transporter permease [Oxobacter pfennigii]KPU42449.1 glutathione transport system permease protein GsiC [Oxobacter pfennigii]
MRSYIIKRILSLIPVLLVVSMAIFLITYLTPGGPASTLLGMEATQEQINTLNESMGFNRPIYVQYFDWIIKVLQGDWGHSIFMRQPVLEAIKEHFSPTLSLAVLAQLVAIFLSVPVGIFAAYKRGSALDLTLVSISLLGIAIPGFLLGMFLMLFFGVYLKWLPVAGYAPLSKGLLEHLRYMILPAISLGTVQAALISRMTRSSMIGVLYLNYIKTARAKGLRETRVLLKHAFKNAALPILTVIGQSFGALVTGAIVTETLFNIPGLGRLIINAISRRDVFVIQGVVLFVTLLYVGVNLTVDLLYGVLDPRVKLEENKGG